MNAGCVYHDASSKGWKHGRRVLSDRWVAEILVDGVRHRHRSVDRKDCEEWLRGVRSGRIKPTDKGADWLRMEQKCDMPVRYDEIITSSAEEALLLYEYHQSGDLSRICEYMTARLLPHMMYYCCHTLRLGLNTSKNLTRQAAGLLLTKISAGEPVAPFTRIAKKMLRIHKSRGDFWYYERSPKDVRLFVDNVDYGRLAEVWQVTRDKRL